MQSKFWNLYRQYVTEQQDPNQPQAVTDIEGGATPPEADVQPDITEQQPAEPAEQQLDTSGFVTLVRLLKDAFVVSPKDEDADTIINIGEINGDNVYDKFKVILSLIKKYNPEIDLDLSLDKVQK